MPNPLPRLILVATLLLAGCAATPPAGEDPGFIAPQGSEQDRLAALPGSIAGMQRRGEVAPDATPGILAGAIARYEQQGAFATLYLFRDSPGPVPDGPDSRGVRQHFAQAAELARVRLIQGHRDSKPEAGQVLRFLVRSPDATPLRCVQFVLPLPDRAISDFTCMTGVAGSSFKLRLTVAHALAGEEEVTRMASAFAAEVMRHLSPPPGLRT
jgi:hypothetical protein